MFSPKYGAARGRLSQRFLSCRSKGLSLLRHACISSQAAPKVRMCPDKMIPFYGVTTPLFTMHLGDCDINGGPLPLRRAEFNV